jgi:hypothetical protein
MPEPDEAAASLYLELLKKVLIGTLFPTYFQRTEPPKHLLKARTQLNDLGFAIVKEVPLDLSLRLEGRDWPVQSHSMIGQKRLDNLHACMTDVIRHHVPGDVIETGVWRGGATIFMRAVLKAYGVTDRTVWVADSFKGLPRPNEAQYPADRGDTLWTWSELAIPLESVKANFERYGLLDAQVCFLEGWFSETLPSAPIEQLAVMRLDGDMYESTMDALRALYPKLSVGGYAIIDDYGAIEACRQAVHDYRTEMGIREELRPIDWTGVYWQRKEA